MALHNGPFLLTVAPHRSSGSVTFTYADLGQALTTAHSLARTLHDCAISVKSEGNRMYVQFYAYGDGGHE